MKDEDRKRLTEYLGECWHENKKPTIEELEKILDGPAQSIEILPTGELKVSPYNRTFTTPDDMVAVKDRMEKKGDWERFFYWQFHKWLNKDSNLSSFAAWLFRPMNEKGEPHFCQLAADWMREGEMKYKECQCCKRRVELKDRYVMAQDEDDDYLEPCNTCRYREDDEEELPCCFCIHHNYPAPHRR